MTWPTFALFTGDAPLDDSFHGLVIRRCKVFACGDYPDKAFSLNPDEARAAVATFAPVDLDIQHVPTVLDGRLGKLLSLELEPDGRTLVGDVGLQRWLDRVLTGIPVEVSAAWDRATKRLMRLALVVRGRIPDAVLMSAFAEFEGRRNSGTDQQRIQQMHDLASELGASCGMGVTNQGPTAMWAGFAVAAPPNTVLWIETP